MEERQIASVDITDELSLLEELEFFNPDVIVHLAEQPSAPFSMKSCEHAANTQVNNIKGTLNLIWSLRELKISPHIVKLGTMGEYGDSIYNVKGLRIPESPQITVRASNHTLSEPFNIPVPRWAGSFYHWSKVFDSFNLEFACKLWGLRVTDINQAPVYGFWLGEGDSPSRFDYDEAFGTVINRFVVQAVAGVPLTVYGRGGQTRGFIHITDSMRSMELAILHPPREGEFRIVNQLTEVFSVSEIAELVATYADCHIAHLENPRMEKEEHFYNPTHEQLKCWGLDNPATLIDTIPGMLTTAETLRERIRTDVILPKTSWK